MNVFSKCFCYSSQGAICLVSIYGTHHNPAVWTNPHVRNEPDFFSLWLNVVMFDLCDFLSFRSFNLSVLTQQTQMGGLLTPSSPSPQAPGTASSLLQYIRCDTSRNALVKTRLCFSQELYWSEIRLGRATSRGGVDPAQVSSDPGGEP